MHRNSWLDSTISLFSVNEQMCNEQGTIATECLTIPPKRRAGTTDKKGEFPHHLKRLIGTNPSLAAFTDGILISDQSPPTVR